MGWKPSAENEGWFNGPNGEFERKPPLDMLGIITLAGAIRDMGALTSLDLSANDLYDEGAKIVAEAIKVTN
jgi:hypothetical protein